MRRDWSRQECEEVVADYLEMLAAENRNEPYCKADHRRELLPKLNDRTEGSVEFKHQNISAILLANGHACIPGYKPGRNYQALLEDVVLTHIVSIRDKILSAEDDLIGQVAHQKRSRLLATLSLHRPR